MGHQTGKVVGFDPRCKDCSFCNRRSTLSEPIPKHDCPKNWSGSSKAMEPDVGAQLGGEVEEKNVHVDVMIMDDDCTTMAKIKNTVDHPVEKWSDTNHTRKQVGNKLYNLQKKHKCLTSDDIQFILKCFSYAIPQNKDKPSELASAIHQIVPHVFGEHEQCNPSWCNYHSNPETYRHSTLRRDLSGDELRKDMEALFHEYDVNAEKIAPGGSTREVESFNNMITSQAPKRIHYSSTGSLRNRVSCAVAQKNIGCHYVSEVNKQVGISPGVISRKIADRREQTSKRRLSYESTKNFKKRRLEKKLEQKSRQSGREVREGVTYKTGVANSHIYDITEIPAPASSPGQTPVQNSNNHHFVFADIETTSLHKTCDIIQIAAICQKESFEKYILPTQSISPFASEVTGLTVVNNKLFCNGKVVAAVPLIEVLKMFIAWLENKQPCVLIGHNFFRFDFPRIIRAFETCEMLGQLETSIAGIADTLPLFRNVYPNMESYRQEHLVSVLLHEQYSAHNAVADVCALQKLVQSAELSVENILHYSCTAKAAFDNYLFSRSSEQNLVSLHDLVNKKVLSKAMAQKVANSGLCLEHLKLAITRGGIEGLSYLFKEKKRVW